MCCSCADHLHVALPASAEGDHGTVARSGSRRRDGEHTDRSRSSTELDVCDQHAARAGWTVGVASARHLRGASRQDDHRSRNRGCSLSGGRDSDRHCERRGRRRGRSRWWEEGGSVASRGARTQIVIPSDDCHSERRAAGPESRNRHRPDRGAGPSIGNRAIPRLRARFARAALGMTRLRSG